VTFGFLVLSGNIHFLSGHPSRVHAGTGGTTYTQSISEPCNILHRWLRTMWRQIGDLPLNNGLTSPMCSRPGVSIRNIDEYYISRLGSSYQVE
jgi:hypothetical protein